MRSQRRVEAEHRTRRSVGESKIEARQGSGGSVAAGPPTKNGPDGGAVRPKRTPGVERAGVPSARRGASARRAPGSVW